MKSRVFVCANLVVLASFCSGDLFADSFPSTTAQVGRDQDSLVTPANQIVTAAGTQVDLPGMRPQALALSPDGRLLVTAGITHELVAVDPVGGKILQRVILPAGTILEPAPVSSAILDADEKAQLSYTGLTFSPDGSRIYFANVNGDIKVFNVAKDRKITASFSIALPPFNLPGRTNDIPAGMAVSADGKELYVALNLSNQLLEMEAATGKILRLWDVGTAPFDVVLAGKKAYVSNWGGRRPDWESRTGPAGRGTRVRVDARSIASEGSVTVIDLAGPATDAAKEIVVGPHASALAVSPNGRWLVVASAGNDTLSVIDTRKDTIVETLCARQKPGDAFGAQPDALAFDASGKTLYCANASQNAVAVFRFKPRETAMLGLIPTGWFPSSLAFNARNKGLCVANLRGIGVETQKSKYSEAKGFNSKQHNGSLSLIPLPSEKELAGFTQRALANLRYPLLAQVKLPARSDRAPVPVPERVGEPSVFKHVLYIIKENRTYDQVLGDVKEGNGDASLCNFGEHVTPNEHKLVHDFTLLDNIYCASVLSADGHNWTDSGLATDYLERSFAGWPRSYPSGGDGKGTQDALAYSPAGFIWDNALGHGRTVHDFGEFCTTHKRWTDPERKGKIKYADTYADFLSGSNAIEYTCEPDIESMRPFIETNWISWDLAVPDVLRAARFIQRLGEFEAQDNLPDLTIFWLPNDHTDATKTNSPTPNAMVADNDLALGRIIEAVSRSKFWKDTCVFVIEDDPQNGWDHVSGFRTTAYVVSAYTRRHAVVSTQYNQTSVLRTMELMLGLPPMNQYDATATPMFDCFTNVPDYEVFAAVSNNVPLGELNPPSKKIQDAQRRNDVYVSARLPLEKPDQCPEDVLNHILWRATMPDKPYPDWAVKVVDDD